MKISYQRSYSIGPFLQERIGFEVERDENMSIIEEVEGLKKLCDEAHRKLNPNLPADYSDIAGHPQQVIQQEGKIREVQTASRESMIQSCIEAVQAASSRSMVLIFKKRVEEYNDQRLTEAYNNKLTLFEQ